MSQETETRNDEEVVERKQQKQKSCIWNVKTLKKLITAAYCSL